MPFPSQLLEHFGLSMKHFDPSSEQDDTKQSCLQWKIFYREISLGILEHMEAKEWSYFFYHRHPSLSLWRQLLKGDLILLLFRLNKSDKDVVKNWFISL